ncbi:hypothetical protein CDG81_01585 [Actinopolyspora erythraea]|uniref:DUF6779 domain-containing protein n=1 Tax=Actinopolyspora erythraea TaxID=414996 RepID=A0A223RMX3_9ACTN|nr:DUF6779 domain-containing protein [Actinopolyspora erythraea]ASU77218.1 hypothetical protein CDG81_01585 [Actinopolyspora erythraea]
MADPIDSESRSRRDRATLLWLGTSGLALAATVVLILGDDVRMLRLGILAALWAALLPSLWATRLRTRQLEQHELLAERQRCYELELEREVEAREEYETAADNEALRRVREETETEVAELRAELHELRRLLNHPNPAGTPSPAAVSAEGSPREVGAEPAGGPADRRSGGGRPTGSAAESSETRRSAPPVPAAPQAAGAPVPAAPSRGESAAPAASPGQRLTAAPARSARCPPPERGGGRSGGGTGSFAIRSGWCSPGGVRW